MREIHKLFPHIKNNISADPPKNDTIMTEKQITEKENPL